MEFQFMQMFNVQINTIQQYTTIYTILCENMIKSKTMNELVKESFDFSQLIISILSTGVHYM